MIKYEKLLTYKVICLDSRDLERLLKYMKTKEDLATLLKNNDITPYNIDDMWIDIGKPIGFTVKNIFKDFKDDCVFAIDKAEDQRGISTSFMYDVMCMWCWILEIDILDAPEYYDYGLEFFKWCRKQV